MQTPTTLQHIITIFKRTPYHLFSIYFDTLCQTLVKPPNSFVAGQVNLLAFLCWLRAVQNLCLFFTSKWTSAHVHFLLLDASFFRQASIYNVILASVCFLTFKQLRLSYFCHHFLACSTLIYRILIERQKSYLLEAFDHDSKRNLNYNQVVVYYINFFQIFLYFTALFPAVIEGAFLYAIYSYHYEFYFTQNFFTFCCLFPFAQLTVMHTVLVVVCFAHVSLLNSATVFVMTLAIFRRFDVLNHCLCADLKKARAGTSILESRRNFEQFFRLHTVTVVDTFSVNGACGPLFLLILLIYGPFNGYLVLSLLFHSLDALMRAFVTPFMSGQVLAILVFHYALALYSNKIHAHSKLLLSGFVKRMHMKRTSRLHLQLSLYIERFLTRKRYGICYGKVGLIPASSFAKV